VPSLREAQERHSLFYNSFVQSNADAFDLIDQEFEQIQIAVTWLIKQTELEQAASLLNFVRGLSPYLQGRALNADLLNYCQNALQAAEQLGTNSGWLHLLRHRAFWALGKWESAYVAVQSAIWATEGSSPKIHARAVLALGRLQLNRGQYQEALGTLATAEDLLMNVGDHDGVATAKAEVAAYYLNRNEHKKALRLYLEVDELRKRANPDMPSHHSLLMLGVVYRRLGDYGKSRQLLSELIQHGKSQKDRGAVATGKHHLAWTYFDLQEWETARKLGLEAKEIYEELRDTRGSSDADEQLGLISLAQRDFAASEVFLTRSLLVREQLGNQHGAASALRRLAKLHLAQRHFFLAFQILHRSLSLYHQLGILSCRRFFAIISGLFK
jgi:tetratricopeptide (TPR) repeat protein